VYTDVMVWHLAEFFLRKKRNRFSSSQPLWSYPNISYRIWVRCL